RSSDLFTIDEARFTKEMEKQRQRARKARDEVNSMQVQDDLLRNLDIKSTFTGYDTLTGQTTIAKMIRNGHFIDDAHEGEEIFFILESTPFYAESGGQIRSEERRVGKECG